MPALHLVTKRGDARAWRLIAAAADSDQDVFAVLLQDAVLETPAALEQALGSSLHQLGRLSVLACRADALARGAAERWALVDYPGIVELVAAASPVISW